MKFVILMLSFGLVACQVEESSKPASDTGAVSPQEGMTPTMTEHLAIEQLKVSPNFSFETQSTSVVIIDVNGSLTTLRLQLFYDDIKEEHLVFETRQTENAQRVELTLPLFAQHLVVLWVDDINKTQVKQTFRLSDVSEDGLRIWQPN